MLTTYSLPLSIRERIRQMISALSSPMVTTPTFSEVSTTPFATSELRITPFGVALSSWTKASRDGTVSAALSVVTDSSTTVRFFSFADSSFFRISRYTLESFFSSSAFAAGTATVAKASRGMALRRVPPLKSTRRRSSSAAWSARKRASSLLALPRPR